MDLKPQRKYDQSGYDEIVCKILKIVQKFSKLLEKENKSLKKKEVLKNEWKEAAKRLDFVLFIAATAIIFSTPIYYFGPYLFQNDLKNIRAACGCSNY